MKLLVYATKPDGYWWKAPSWSDGKKFSLEVPVELDLEGDDLERLKADVKDGFYLRYKDADVAEAMPAPEPKPKKVK